MKLVQRICLCVLIASLALAACAPAAPSKAPIKVAVLPVLDSLPLYVAQSKGYFKARGVEVELVAVASAPERDALMQAGQVDGMLNEIVSTILYNRDQVRIKNVRFARTATAKTPVFHIVAAKDAGIQSVADLKGVQIGISEGTVIEYTTDRILQKAGFAPEDIQKVAVPKIPDRMALVGSGELKAANLPDPSAAVLLQQGAVNVIDDTSYPEISTSVWSFSVASIKKNPEGVRSFLAAVEDAVKDLNANKTGWDDLLKQNNLMPAPLIGKFPIPDYPTAAVPSQAQFADALDWLKTKGLIKTELKYSDAVDASFLPK